jgi:hypothetical protein
LRVRRRENGDAAAYETGCADALKEKIAGKVVAAGLERLQRRIEHRLDFNKGASGRRGAALHGEPHALRLLPHAAAFHILDAQHEAVGFLAFFAQFDEAGDRHARRRKAQHWMRHERSLRCRDRKANRHRAHAKRHYEPNVMPAESYSPGNASNRKSNRRPACRLALRREVENDAEAIGDSKPREEPAPDDLFGGPLADFCREQELGMGAPRPTPDGRRPAKSTPGSPTRGSSTCGLTGGLPDCPRAPLRAPRAPKISVMLHGRRVSWRERACAQMQP